MFKSRGFRFFAVSVLIATQVAAVAQDAATTIADLLNGKSLPVKVKPADLPADYKAARITVASGGGGMGDMLGMMMPLMMMGMLGGAMGGGEEQGPGMGLFAVLDVSWTKGDVVKMNGREFLVTYKPNLDLMKMMSSKESGPPKSIDLALTLIATDSFSSITPVPDLTKEDLVKLAESLGKGAGGGPPDTHTLSNAKQLGLAMNMYVSDYDDVLPYAQSTKAVQMVTYPYIKNVDVWKTDNPNGGQFLFNMALAGVATTSIDSPAETVMFYETNEWPDGRRAVAYVDAHAKLVSKEEWTKLKDTLSLKVKKACQPLPLNYGLDWEPGK